MNQPDELDRQILNELQKDGRRSYREIAKTVGAAAGTVRTRVMQLTESGLVSIVAIPNLQLLGFNFHALVGVKVAPGQAVETAKLLVPEEAVTWVALTATGYDILVEVATRDAREFGRYREEVLAQLPGFVSCDVFVYWDLLKFGYDWEPENHSDSKDESSDESATRSSPGTGAQTGPPPRKRTSA